MRNYSKAYVLGDLRRFSGWSKSAAAEEREYADEDIVYLADDLVVLADPIREEGMLFDQITAEWREFCAVVLGFAIPDDLTYLRPGADDASAPAEGRASEEPQHG
ncbi:hypothetical protein [Streptomyces mirabilis]|uniref:hypothetical protein n=1 Tax=Streptomyces mirabilis TaxID=68239 RepID=UPI0036ECF0BA